MKHKIYKSKLQTYFDDIIKFHYPLVFKDYNADLNITQLYYQYQALKLILNNIADNIQLTIENWITVYTDLELNEFINRLKKINIQPVLTAHPTEPFSSCALDEIHNIHIVLENSYPVVGDINDSLLKLMNMSLTPTSKLTPKQEIDDNIVYLKKINSCLLAWRNKIMTDITTHFVHINSSQIQQLNDHIGSMVKIRSWVGSDADGNDNIDSNTMGMAIYKHINHLGQSNNIKIDVRQNTAVYTHIFKVIQSLLSTSLSAAEIIIDSNMMMRLEDCINNVDKSNVLLFKEIERLKIIAQYPDIFENLIIAGVESINDIITPILLCKIIKVSPHIIPLFESKSSLIDSKTIINDLLNFRAYSDHINIQKVMIGYSDSERESGIFILPLIHNAIINLRCVAKSQGIEISFFHGNGLDLSRGGPNIIVSEQTIQGNHKRFLFSTQKTTINYFTRIVNQLLKSQDDEHSDLIELFAKNSIDRYEEVFISQYEHLNQYLLYASPYNLFVRTHNFSSRNTNRNSESKQSDVLVGLRAISQVNVIEGTFTNFNIWLGFKEFINQIKVYTVDNNLDIQSFINSLFLNSTLVSDMYLKALIAIETADFETARQHFPPRSNSAAYKFYQFIYNEYKQTVDLIKELRLSLPTDVTEQISSRQDLALHIKQFMAHINCEIIYKDDTHEPKNIHEFFDNGSNNDKVIAKLMGAIYCGFTEARTSPFAMVLHNN